ncbi:unnamed protein product [Mortierella alpina]
MQQIQVSVADSVRDATQQLRRDMYAGMKGMENQMRDLGSVVADQYTTVAKSMNSFAITQATINELRHSTPISELASLQRWEPSLSPQRTTQTAELPGRINCGPSTVESQSLSAPVFDEEIIGDGRENRYISPDIDARHYYDTDDEDETGDSSNKRSMEL